MKRDMELIRTLLLHLEEAGEEEKQQPSMDSLGYSDEQVAYHAFLLVNAGLATGIDASDSSCETPWFIPRSLTWEGHEFLDAARSEERWCRAKAIMNEAKGFCFEVMKELLVTLFKQQVSGML